MDLDPNAQCELEIVISAAAKHDKQYVIGVDIGGTNTRVAVCSLDGKFATVAKFLASSKKQLLDGLTGISEALVSKMGAEPSASCLDIAGPVSEMGTFCNITNYLGTEEEKALRANELPSKLFPPGRTRFVNDLESCCYGILGLKEHNKLSEFFAPLWGSDGNKVEIAPVHYAVMAAGTGLGVGLLIKLGSHDFQVMPLEYGHALITPLGTADPDKDLDQKLIDHLSETLYKGKQSPEYEDVVSGRGLEAVYHFLSRGEKRGAGEIVAAANSGNEHALKAVEIHYRVLIRAAQNICIGMNVKGVFFAGDNQVENAPLVKNIVKLLQDDFLDHPKRHWIENAPVFAQTVKYNINLYGTLYVARGIANTK